MPVAILPTPRGPSAFTYRDPEGAPGADGITRHGALDWFAAGGTPVGSACHGQVVEVRPSRGSTGQVFGGTVKVAEAISGRVYVCRHVEPAVHEGQHVAAGDRIASVTNWRGGADHVHLEVWRSLAGGYRLANMIDPGLLDWTAFAKPAPELPWPPPHGGGLRLALPGRPLLRGWDECRGPLEWIAAHGMRSDRCALAWKGDAPRARVWRGAKDVNGVARNLVARFLTPRGGDR